MKKQPKKLTLNRETLRSLKENALVPANGGGSGALGSLCECTYMDCSEQCFQDPSTVVPC